MLEASSQKAHHMDGGGDGMISDPHSSFLNPPVQAKPGKASISQKYKHHFTPLPTDQDGAHTLDSAVFPMEHAEVCSMVPQ